MDRKHYLKKKNKQKRSMTDQPLIRKQNLNAFTDINIKGQNIKILFHMVENTVGKRENAG